MEFLQSLSLDNFTGVITIMKFAAGAVFAMACLLLALFFITRKKGIETAGLVVFFTGWLVSAAIFVLSWVNVNYPPFSNMYHVLMSMGIFIPLLYLVVWLKDKHKFTHIFFAAAAVASLTGAIIMSVKNPASMTKELMPALQSNWFIPHVAAYVISYSLMAVAFLMTLLGFLLKACKQQTGAETLYTASFHVVKLSFPFMTFGLLSGAIWAGTIWGGAYWSWDIKETWALILWSLYIVYFHCRLSNSFRKYANLIQVLAFLALIYTFILVNFRSNTNSLHTYSQAQSAK